MTRLVEILYFDGCPGMAAAAAVVEAVVRDTPGLSVEVRRVAVADAAAARALRFLGSPTVRVDGRDVDPDAVDRCDYAMQCRIYAVDGALRNVPAREWIERALGVPAAGRV